VCYKLPEPFQCNQLVIPSEPELFRMVASQAGLFSRRVQLGRQALLNLASPETLWRISGGSHR